MTAESYVPTTDEVRAVWREWNGYGGLISRTGPEPTTRAGMVAEFDSWLDQVRAVARREGQAEALRAAARSMRSHKDPGHWNLRDEIDPVNAGQSPDAWLERRADRIENGDLVVPPTPNPYEEDR